MKCPLGISNFLEEISSLSHYIVSVYFFALITGWLSYLSLLFFGTLHSNGYSFPFLLWIFLSSFHSYLSGLLSQPFYLFAFLLLGDGFDHASCTMSWTSVHSSSVCLSDLIPWIYWSLPLHNHKGFDLGHTWMAYWFSLFSSILNFAVRISWSEPQSVPCLVFADCIVLHHLCCKEYNQSDFSIDHLVMSTCRVISCVVRLT